jgi:hypothetical protein
MSMRSRFVQDLASATALGALLVAGACGSPAAGPSSGPRVPFIAFAQDFASFRAWPSNTFESPATTTIHVGGLRTVYINQLPAADATTFPVGTMIVKATATDGKLFARVKRGGGYNKAGALDWEWFELEETAAGAVVVRWHGFGPPAGEMYGGDANGGCNQCHIAAVTNDYVLSPWLALPGNALPPIDPAPAAASPSVITPGTKPPSDAGSGDATPEEAPRVP